MNIKDYLLALADAQVRRWNAIVPKRAIDVRETADKTHFEYLHPTKGWKPFSKRRVFMDKAARRSCATPARAA